MINFTGLDRVGKQVGLTCWLMLKWLHPAGLPKETFPLPFLMYVSVSVRFAGSQSPFQSGWFPALALGTAGCATVGVSTGEGAGAGPDRSC